MRRASMSVLLILAVVVASCLVTPSFSQAEQINLRAGYDFPYRNPYLSSLTARLLKPSRVAPTFIQIDGLPGRQNISLLEGRDKVTVSLFAQTKPAPVVYIIPGIGGAAVDGAALWLGEQAYLQGFSAIVVPSPFNWQFVLSQSTTAIPGFTPEDVKDLRRLMVQAKRIAERQHGLKVTRSAVVGYSLGGINAAYLMKFEREASVLGIERAVLIDPPLHIPAAIAELDRLNSVGDQWTRNDRNAIWGRIIQVAMDAMERDINDPGYFVGLDRAVPLQNQELQYLIGNAFRQTLSDTLFVSQQVRDIGLFRTPATRFSRNGRYSEAAVLTFAKYIERGAWPFWKIRLGADWTVEQFVAQGDLLSIKEFVVTDPAFRLLHNQDDFLTRSQDLNDFARAMGNRAIIYPYGGHVGNLWGAANQADLAMTLQDLL